MELPKKLLNRDDFIRIVCLQEMANTTEFVNYVSYPKNRDGEVIVVFDNVVIEEELIVENHITYHLIFNKCNLFNLQIKKKSHIKTICFNNGSTTGILNIESEDLIQVRTSNSIIESIKLYNLKQCDFFNIECSNVGSIDIDNCLITNINIINNSKIGDIELINSSKVIKFYIFDNQSGYENQQYNEVKSIIINSGASINNFSCIKSKIKDLRVRDAQLYNILFKSSIANEIILTFAKFVRIEIIEKTIVNRFRPRLPLDSPSQITFNNSEFNEIDFSSTVFSEHSTMQISSCKVNTVKIQNFCNYGTMLFNNLSPISLENSFFYLVDSDLGKVQIINSYLNKYNKFVYSNTKMLEMFVAGSEMPNVKSFALPQHETDLIKEAEQKRLAYGQFKKIYESRGDIAGSLQYLAFEMDAYLKQLIYKKRPEKIGEVLMLLANKISTNYGNNWLQGAIITLLVVFGCFAKYLNFIGYEAVSFSNWNEGSISLFKDLFSYAPQFLNPLRDNDSVLPDEYLPKDIKGNVSISNCARIWDYISRIIVAYFVYQTIQAFRKLGKSSG